MEQLAIKQEEEIIYRSEPIPFLKFEEDNYIEDKIDTNKIVHLKVDPTNMCIIEEQEETKCIRKTENLDEVMENLIKIEDIVDIKSEETERNEELINELDITGKCVTRTKKKQPPFECCICSYATKHKKSLKRHLDKHKNATDPDFFECHICGYKSRQIASLKVHMLIHKDHSEITWYKCTLCPYVSKLKNGVTAHMITHKSITEVPVYRCEECSHVSKVKADLRKHQLIHKPRDELVMHKCPKCTYETRQKHHINQHMLSHRTDPEVPVFICHMCAHTTKHKSNLIKHILRHRNPSDYIKPIKPLPQENEKSENTLNFKAYQCTVCDHQSRSNTDLRRHMLRHQKKEDVVLFKCATCMHETKRKNDLINHMLVHRPLSEVTLYMCGLCDYKAKHKSNLKTHMLRHKKTKQSYICDKCHFSVTSKKKLVKHFRFEHPISRR